MHTIATDRVSSSSAYMSGVGLPNPFDSPAPRSRNRSGSVAAPSTVGTAVETPRLRLFTAPSRAVQASAPPVMRMSSIGSLMDDLDSGLSLDGAPSAATPIKRRGLFECASPGTTVATDDEATPLFGSRKRLFDEPASPAFTFNAATPTPAAAQSRLTRPRARASMLVASPCVGGVLPLFTREGHNTDEDSSFDDDGSLTSLPRMRRPTALASIMEDHDAAESATPLRGQATRIKRVRGLAQPRALARLQPAQPPQTAQLAQPVPPALAVHPATPTRARMAAMLAPAELTLSPTFSPSARSQPECHLLPCTTAPTDSIMRIDAQTASDLLGGGFSHLVDEHIFVDCRFPYEYDGGHIAGAVNAPTPDVLEKLLLARPISDRRVVVVLHCEYSIQRAPSLASHLRRRDREVNMHRYPHLHYPEIYVLKGGYRGFFEAHKRHCEPQSYVEMNDRAFAVDCRQRMMQFNRQFKRTKSMNDAGMCRAMSARPAAPPPSLSSGALSAFGTLNGSNSNSNSNFGSGFGSGSSSGALFFSAAPLSPTTAAPRVAPSLLSSASLPARPRRMARTQSARPGINIINFSAPPPGK
ncbi:m-phase inducer phosphatase [Coemansia sp. RSA 1804]|nr:m-phase inducer phosphatase [Coemansia sp. RSA 1804]